MPGLDSSFQVERQKFSEPPVTHRSATDALDDGARFPQHPNGPRVLRFFVPAAR